LDVTREPGENTVPVIINRGSKGEKATYVHKGSWKIFEDKVPSGYAEAVMQQCPDLEALLVSVCRAFAKCDIGRDVKGFEKIVAEKMNEAVAWQEEKGSKAMYRRIKYDG